MNIHEETLKIARNLIKKDPSLTDWVISKFPELADSEDERIRKELIAEVKEQIDYIPAQDCRDEEDEKTLKRLNKWLAWLEKQDEQKSIKCNMEWYDFVRWFVKERTDNYTLIPSNTDIHKWGGIILDHAKKELEKQGEQIPTDKAEQKFKKGDVIRRKDGDGLEWTVEDLHEDGYYTIVNSDRDDFIKLDDNWELVEQQPTEWHREDEQNLNACLGYIPDEFLRRWLTDAIHAKYDKPADKVEPKFEIGDLITNGILVGKIDEIHELGYHAYFGDHYADVPDAENWHKWTIQDAKDGDVLVASDGSIFLFKDTIDCACKHYAAITTDGTVKFNEGLEHFWETSTAVHPATKEQRDLLFKKMHEAGYEWDADKKELKKIDNEEFNGEDYGIDSLYHAQRILEKTLGVVEGYQTDDGILDHKCAISAVKELSKQQKPWSEEDEINLEKAIWYVENPAPKVVKDSMLVEWFKSLKNRVLPQNLTVTDEELIKARNEAYNDALNKIEYHSDTPTFNDGWSAAIWYLKKRNAQPQSTWKPNKSQIEALDTAIRCGFDSGTWEEALNDLLWQLKKLREK